MNHPARVPSRLLTDILLEAGVVTTEQIDAGLARQRENGLRIGESLVEMGVVREEDIGWALARQLGIPFLDVSVDAIDHDLVRGYGDTLLHQLQALPLVRGDDSLSVAFADPTDPESVAEIERIAGCRLEMGVATPTAIRAALDAVFGHRRERRAPGGDSGTAHNVLWDRTGSAFVMFHVRQALRAGATELHFMPSGGSLQVQHRVNGRLVAHAEEPASSIYGLLSRLETLGVPVIDDDRHWTAGRFELQIADRALLVDATLLVEDQGIAATLMLTPRAARVAALDDLGVDPAGAARVRDALAATEGLILVTAPPRGGGTTTLRSLLDAVDRGGRRAVCFGPPAATPLPADVHDAQVGTAPATWGPLARGLGADVVALDGVSLADLTALSGPEASGRLVLARLGADEPFEVLERMARHDARETFARRLRFVWGQRLEAAAGSADSGDDGRRGDRRAVIDVVHATDAVRAALRDGAGADRFRDAYGADGGRGTGRDDAPHGDRGGR